MESRKLISATDTLYSGTLLASLNEQRIHGLYCDVTVIIGDKRFRAHKNILSASSTYFHQLFSVVDQVVELTFVRAEIFAEILNYIYSSKILRVRSDLLEELIKSGKFLGVKFLADLEVPLSHMKSMAGGVKDNSAEASPSCLDQKVITDKTVTEQPAISKSMKEDSIITATATEKIIIPREEITELQKNPIFKEEGEDSDNDVIFCSQFEPPKPDDLIKPELSQQKIDPVVVTLGNSQMSASSNAHAQTLLISKVISTNNLPIKTVVPSQTNSLCVTLPSPNQTLVSGTTFAFSQNPQLPTTMLLNPQLFNAPTLVSFQQRHFSPRINLMVPRLPSVNTILKQPVIIAKSSFPSSPHLLTNSLRDQGVTNTEASFIGPKIQSSQTATLTEQTTSKTSELNIKVENVETEISDNCAGPASAVSQHIIDGESILTLDTPSKIEGLLTSSTINTDDVENTFEMVVPIKEDSDYEDDDGAVELPRSVDGSPDCKRVKVKHEDHYELLIDGKVYYVCIVCKRSYMQVGSLKRHHNCHSWVKKYPCHFCERVFPLAEYRTKHERQHTGEKRYQCMTCGEHFMDHRIMTNHVKSVHNLDPVADPTLYHLHSLKEWQTKLSLTNFNAPTSPVPPVVKEEIVYNVNNIKEEPVSEEIDCRSPSKNVRWEDIFPPQGEEVVIMQSPNHCSTEFEFVIPESY